MNLSHIPTSFSTLKFTILLLCTYWLSVRKHLFLLFNLRRFSWPTLFRIRVNMVSLPPPLPVGLPPGLAISFHAVLLTFMFSFAPQSSFSCFVPMLTEKIESICVTIIVKYCLLYFIIILIFTRGYILIDLKEREKDWERHWLPPWPELNLQPRYVP